MNCRRRLTANGPMAAYDIVMSSQIKSTEGNGIADIASLERILSSQGKATRQGAARKNMSMGTPETPEGDGGSARHSPYMRYKCLLIYIINYYSLLFT